MHDIQENIKRIINHDQIDFISNMQGFLTWGKSVEVNPSHYYISEKFYDHLNKCGGNVW